MSLLGGMGIIGAGGGGGGAGYAAHAVKLDGTNDYLTRGAGLTGAADSKTGLVSFWINFKGGDATLQRILYAATVDLFLVEKRTTNKFRIYGTSSSSTKLELHSSSAYTSSSGWIHFLASWDLSTPETYLYINDANDEGGGGTAVDSTIDLTHSDWGIGAEAAGNQLINADLADFYFEDTFLDISVLANRRKFIDSGGKPVDLGSDGSTPTGSSPLIVLNDQVTAGWESNNGTGGGMSENGALADGADSPSD